MEAGKTFTRDVLIRSSQEHMIDTPIVRYGQWETFHAAELEGKTKSEMWLRGSLYLFGGAGLRLDHGGPLIPDTKLSWAVEKDEVRLRMDAWPDNAEAQTAQDKIATGKLTGLSIEYSPVEVEPHTRGDMIKRGLILNVALVPKPAYGYAILNRSDEDTEKSLPILRQLI